MYTRTHIYVYIHTHIHAHTYIISGLKYIESVLTYVPSTAIFYLDSYSISHFLTEPCYVNVGYLKTFVKNKKKKKMKTANFYIEKNQTPEILFFFDQRPKFSAFVFQFK